MPSKTVIQNLLENRSYVRVADIVCDPHHPNRPHVLPISRSTLWRWVREGRFPRPTRLSPGVSAWRVSDVLNWNEATPNADGA